VALCACRHSHLSGEISGPFRRVNRIKVSPTEASERQDFSTYKDFDQDELALHVQARTLPFHPRKAKDTFLQQIDPESGAH
jgi:hypothetical protein